MKKIAESELILNPDGSIYHLNLRPEQVAHDIITVGDPGRVDRVTQHFDEIECTVSKREFKTTTGRIGNKRLTVISTGIGTDNIDIVFNELDALVNIDFERRTVKSELTPLNFYRIGTSGSMQADIPVDEVVISQKALGMDGLMHAYPYKSIEDDADFIEQITEKLHGNLGILPYTSQVGEKLFETYKHLGTPGITITALGFYAPQNRTLRMAPSLPSFLNDITNINCNGLKLTNLEMETAAIYGLSNLMGHEAISFNAILANRVKGTFSKKPKELVNNLIVKVLEEITSKS